MAICTDASEKSVPHGPYWAFAPCHVVCDLASQSFRLVDVTICDVASGSIYIRPFLLCPSFYVEMRHVVRHYLTEVKKMRKSQANNNRHTHRLAQISRVLRNTMTAVSEIHTVIRLAKETIAKCSTWEVEMVSS